ncbi:MAG: N-acetylmuramoyl-L-alanine amidase [Paramuribaculum sp.]|nr:N-acetylmuramoyl-L-alanine amidase [Paramuribaculum sp.]
MRQITEIIVHCTATPAGRPVSVTEIDRWHRARGFRSIGYHYVVGLDGTVMEGRPEQQTGAHCKGHNSRSIGVCYVGGVASDGTTPADTRTLQQRAALHTLLKQLKKRYPSAVIHSHRDFAAKACPCFDATGEYADI